MQLYRICVCSLTYQLLFFLCFCLLLNVFVLYFNFISYDLKLKTNPGFYSASFDNPPKLPPAAFEALSSSSYIHTYIYIYIYVEQSFLYMCTFISRPSGFILSVLHATFP